MCVLVTNSPLLIRFNDPEWFQSIQNLAPKLLTFVCILRNSGDIFQYFQVFDIQELILEACESYIGNKKLAPDTPKIDTIYTTVHQDIRTAALTEIFNFKRNEPGCKHFFNFTNRHNFSSKPFVASENKLITRCFGDFSELELPIIFVLEFLRNFLSV